jgi:lipopolysaccharide export system protein LptA
VKRWLAALLLLPLPALAQPIDLSHGGPIDVTAAGGFEWRDQQHEVLAYGDARATRGDATVLADRLTARYRKRAGAAPATAAPATAAPATGAPASGTPAPGTSDTGSTEIYRLEADGHVRIVTPTDEAVGDHAIYDIDQAVLVMTGKNLKLTTPQQVITARDSLEYWSAKHMAVARGAAVVVTADGRRVSADTLVGYTEPKQGAAAQPGRPGDPAASGTLSKVEAFGNVEVRTATDIARGDRGVYVPATGIARLVGNVRITHGQNQINGAAADVNMKTGVARMIATPGERVQGLIMPNDAQPAPGGSKP